MAKKTYGILEQHIIDTFRNDRLFTYRGKLCEVIEAGKPRPQGGGECKTCLLYTSPSPRDLSTSRMPSSA